MIEKNGLLSPGIKVQGILMNFLDQKGTFLFNFFQVITLVQRASRRAVGINPLLR